MKNIIQQRRHGIATFLFSLLSLLFVISACTTEDKPNNGGGGTTANTLAVPVINTQPKSDTITEGNTATLSVGVATHPAAATLTYQWKKAAKGSSTFTDVAGATNASYTTDTLRIADSGTQYKVVVTATSSLKETKSTTSNIATLSVMLAKIVWTHIDGTKKYANAPKNGILLSSDLTATKTDIKSVDIIPNTITSIGEDAFWNCTALTSINIPSSVTSIESFALSNTALTSITIPNSVTKIETSAFQGCSGLTSITIPNSVITIWGSAFEGCSGFMSVTIPSSVTTIGGRAFANCTNLKNVRMERETPPSAGYTMFDNTHRDLIIRVPNASVGTYRNTELWRDYKGSIYGYDEAIPQIKWTDINGIKQSARVPSNGVLGSGTLTENKTDIKSVDTIPNLVTHIGSGGFEGCTALTKINIPNSVSYIAEKAFAVCTGLTSIRIPNSVSSIAEKAFEGCIRLDNVRVEATTPPTAEADIFGNTNLSLIIRVPNESVSAYRSADGWSTYAGLIYGYDEAIPTIKWTHRDGTKHSSRVHSSGVLYGTSLTATVTDIKSVDTIPSIITNIGVSAFEGCINLTSIRITNNIVTISANAFKGCTGLTSITIPSSVTHIGDRAFAGCTGLTSITIPSSVTHIGDRAFESCSALTSVRVEATKPAYAGEYIFSDTSSNLIISIPPGRKDAYVYVGGWNSYINQLKEYQ